MEECEPQNSHPKFTFILQKVPRAASKERNITMQIKQQMQQKCTSQWNKKKVNATNQKFDWSKVSLEAQHAGKKKQILRK